MTTPSRMPRDGIVSHRARAMAWSCALALLLWGVAACATGPRVGIRSDYRDRTVSRIAVFPFYSRSKFGLPRERIETLLRHAERQATRRLRHHGFELLAPRDVGQRLAEASVASTWRSVLHERHLADAFEPESDASREKTPREIELVRRLHRRDIVETRFFLIGELVYHTTTTCRIRAPNSPLYLRAGSTDASPPTCVVTHLQARLVDAETGRTVWFNRRLRELYVSSPRDEALENLRATVERLLEGQDGLLGLSTRRSNGS